jgi:branched-chain amino acid transport system substrate-binding protein
VTGPVAFDARGDVRDGTITLYGFKGGKRSLITVTK